MANRIVKITCRNVPYTCIIAEPQPDQQPKTLNWRRYQVSGQTYKQRPDRRIEYQVPRILNWRWQLLSI